MKKFVIGLLAVTILGVSFANTADAGIFRRIGKAVKSAATCRRGSCG